MEKSNDELVFPLPDPTPTKASASAAQKPASSSAQSEPSPAAEQKPVEQEPVQVAKPQEPVTSVAKQADIEQGSSSEIKPQPTAPMAAPESESTPLVRRTMPDFDVNEFAPTLLHSAEQHTPDIHAHYGVQGFFDDIKNINSGTIPISLLIAAVIGVFCGIAAFFYYTVLEFFLSFMWERLPEEVAHALPFWPECFHWLWIPLVGMTCACLVGASIKALGDPGDLAYTIKRVHKDAYVPVDHAPSMVAASQASIVGGGSLGPEAPLVAICASIGGWVSMTLFGQKYKNLVRKHTLCGMACALAAFFGVPLGGSLFAIEVNSRLGAEYFEHILEAIASGTICLVVFRNLAGLPIGPIYFFTDTLLKDSSAQLVVIGALLGLLGAGIGASFAHLHWWVLKQLSSLGWDTNPRSTRDSFKLAIFGGVGVCTLGVLIPHTFFWGEFEMQTIGSLSPASKLPHIWPTTGATGFEITGFWSATLVGLAKLLAISFTVAGGYRGGFIFPFFAAGAAFGRAVCFLFPSIPPVVAVLSVACGINVTITRTALATPLILCGLAGEVNATPPVLAASLVAVFVTYYLPFIKTQQGREQVLESQLHAYPPVKEGAGELVDASS